MPVTVPALSADQLRWTLPLSLLAFDDTDQATPVAVLPGQPPAREALAQALAATRGGHVLVTGAAGPGRRQALADAVRALAPPRRAPRDLVYVARPHLPDRPCLLLLPPGPGVPFRRALRDLRDELRVAWPEDLDGEQDAWERAQERAFQPLVHAFPAAAAWLGELRAAVAARGALFRPGVDPARRAADGDVEARDLLAAFQAHLFHAAGAETAAPVVVVAEPSAAALAGGQAPARREDPSHLALRSGLLHDAHGGFLVLSAEDLGRDPAATAVLRALVATGRLSPGPADAPGLVRPDPVPLDVRLVVLAGTGAVIEPWGADPDLAGALLQPVQLDPRPEVGPQVLAELAGWLALRGRAAGRAPLSAAAFALLIEHLVREGGRGGRVPLDLDTLDAFAADAASLSPAPGPVPAAAAAAAVQAWAARRAQGAEQARRAMVEGFLTVATDGQVVGQVNGLAVYRSTGFPFARPIRVTCTVGAGRSGVVDVEREVGLAGTAFHKAGKLLAGFVRGRFSRRRTLALHASLAIEQHYGRIDGDSAGLAELAALLSALARVPLRQDRAVTGSVDQLGRVQSIGSVNLKVEGFFSLCQARGLTGAQGVLIPRANQGDLCLAPEVVAACAEGRFHVWAVSTVEEALALLCEVEVGEAEAERWPEDTLYGRVMAELLELEAVVREAAKGPTPPKASAR
ncbi:AAA family ATPase [Myxococcota bacterium]|nr:AAA family ATPase [Myxococcota bacterium]